MPRKDSLATPTSENAMPTPQLTLTEVASQGEEELEDDEDEELSGDPSDAEDESAGTTTMTAAERLAEKRKMKRFRLTHSQTRFLMSEFSRQPHPDAAQRDRLSREIPGLSPRQVQVWFQNRRAKMKRLTGDDQERMMRSRALPSGFDVSRTVQPAGSVPQQLPSALAHFSGPNANFLGGAIGRPVSRGERVPPINMALVYRNPAYSINPAGESSNPSPSSSVNEGATYSANQSPLYAASQNSSPFLSTSVFPRNLNPNSSGLSTQGDIRARAASAVTASHSSPMSSGSPPEYGRDRVSMENLQAMYQSHYDGTSQQNRGLEPHLGAMANLQVNSSSYHPNQNLQSPQNLVRENSAGRMTGSGIEPVFQSISPPDWIAESPIDQTGTTHSRLHTQQIHRRQTQPTQTMQQYQSGEMAPHQSYGPSSSSYQQPASQRQGTYPYATPTTFHSEPRHPSYSVSPVQQQQQPSTVKSETTPTDVFRQSQDYSMYFDPSQQRGPGT